MARIKTYTVDTTVSDKDIIIGTDGDNNGNTKNFQVSDLRQYLLSGLDPETGGTLKITTLTATSVEYLTPEAWINNQEPAIEVLQYEIIFLILNNRTYIFRKNNATYGVGETQAAASDFTEIDITSVINANLQDLESVLNQGRTASLPPEVPSISLENEILNGYGNVSMGDSNDFIFNDGLKDIAHIKDKELQFKSSTNKFIVRAPSLFTNQTATLQNSSGTIAYLSDIPTDYVSSVTTSGEGLSATIDEGVLNINYTSTATPYLINSELLDSISNTTYFSDGGIFEYSEELNPINSILLKFSEDISVVFESPLTIVRVFVFLENNTYQVFNFTKNQMTLQNPQSLLIPFPFSEIWSDVVGERVLSIDISVMPKSISSDEGVLFDGCVPSSICKYVNVF